MRLETPAGEYRRNDIILNGTTWATRCLTTDLPSAAAVQIVADAGYLPADAITIQRGCPNQTMMDDVAALRFDLLKNQSAEIVQMKKIPVIFRERWQLYQTEQGHVFAFDIELLKLIDFKNTEPNCFMSERGHLGMFFYGEYAVYIAPGRFSAQNEEKIRHIAGLDWENQIEHDDPAANISLFDGQKDEALAERDE